MGVEKLKNVLVFLFYRRKFLCLLVPLWLTIIHHEGTKTLRDTEKFVQSVVQ